jgi:aspartate/methionine/tyrosine aminotransferase
LGHPKLVQKIAEMYGERMSREIDPMSEVLVTQGANGSLSSFINAIVNTGDELVTFEPGFPMVYDHVEFAGGKVNAVPLTYDGSRWIFDVEALRQALQRPETKMFLINTPHNPTGKVFTQEEMETISDILDECPHVMVLSDEVYDFLTFDGNKHHIFATVGNNWQRTVTCYSGGKLLNATGWKVGWAIGPKQLIRLGGVISGLVSYSFNAPG